MRKEFKIIPLGGIEEIGKNCTVLEFDNDLLILDAGFKFPSADMPGVDFIIPDFSYVTKRKKNIKGIVLTHGHLDHIGGVSFLLEEVTPPFIIGSDLTLGLVKEMLSRKARDRIQFRVVKSGDILNLGSFIVEFVHMTHSIPGSFGVGVTTPEGTIFHTGDFKIDPTPVDGVKIDLSTLERLKNRGVTVLLSDSTNADEEGFTGSESVVGEALFQIFRNAPGRVIAATFSTNIHRIQQFVDTSEKLGRRVVFDGRSLLESVKIAKKLGYLRIPEGITSDLASVSTIPKKQIALITTGTQGEPMSGLVRISNGRHNGLNITKGDTVIVSADPIPGNERVISDTVNKLFKLGAFVYYRKEDGIHVSGHCSQEDIRFIIDFVRPKYFIPIHGEYKHLVYSSKIAVEENINPRNIFILQNGNGISISNGKVRRLPRVQSGDVLVEGNTKIPVKEGEDLNFISERKEMAHNGILTAVVILGKKGELLHPIRIETKGLLFPRGLEGEIIKSVREKIVETLRKYAKIKTQEELAYEIERGITALFKRSMRKTPTIFAVVYKEKKR